MLQRQQKETEHWLDHPRPECVCVWALREEFFEYFFLRFLKQNDGNKKKKKGKRKMFNAVGTIMVMVTLREFLMFP